MSSDDLQERLVYDVTTSDPRVLFGLELCDVANRNPALPEFYYYNLGVHPQLRNLPRTVDTGTVYVYLVDSSPAGSIKAKSLASTIELPTGMIKPREGNNSLGGLIDLEEGDVVFSRDIAKGGDPEEDALRIIIATRDGDDEMATKRASLTACRDKLLGDRDTRDNRRVWFEEQNRASPVGHGNRCYGLSNMLERPMNASGPPAAMKVVDGKLDAVQLAVKEAVRSTADAGMTMWTRMAPQSLQLILESYAELVNTPRIGCYDNYMWSSTQLNLSEPQRVGEEQSLGATNGRFGDCHVDGGDSPTHLSCATVLSDLPEDDGWEPGRMHFLGIGCYTVLKPFKQFFFTGLLRHGSTRPLTLDSNAIPSWACRAVMISYPPKSMALGKVSHCFSLMPGAKKPFYLTAHTTGAPHNSPANGYFTEHTTMAQDGTSSMDDEGLMNFIARGLFQWSQDVMEQLPARLRVMVDKTDFLGAFKYHDEMGQEIPLKHWPMGPAPDVNNRFEEMHVDAEVAIFRQLYDRMAAGIPGIPANTLEPEYLTNRAPKTRPPTYKLPTKHLPPLPPYDEYRSQDFPEHDDQTEVTTGGPRRSKRIHASMVEESYNLGGEHDISSIVDRMISRKRRKTDEGEEDTSHLRRSIRQDPSDKEYYLPQFPLIRNPSSDSVDNVDHELSLPAARDGSAALDDENILSLLFDDDHATSNLRREHVNANSRPDVGQFAGPSSAAANSSSESTSIQFAPSNMDRVDYTVPQSNNGSPSRVENSRPRRHRVIQPSSNARTSSRCRTPPFPSSSNTHVPSSPSPERDGAIETPHAGNSDKGQTAPPLLPPGDSDNIQDNPTSVSGPVASSSVRFQQPPATTRQQPSTSTTDPSTSALSPTPVTKVSIREQLATSTTKDKPESEKNFERRKKNIQDFCETISGDIMAREMSRIVYGVSFIHTIGLEPLCRSMVSLDGYEASIDPLRMRPDSLSHYMSAFSLAKHQEVTNAAWAIILRQRIILHEFKLGRIVLEMEGKLCDEIFSRGTFLRDPTNWIEELLRDIEAKVVVKQRITLSSTSYLGQSGSAAVRYIEPEWAFKERCWSRKRPSNAEFLRITAKCFGRILRFWLDLPTSFISRGRDQLVDVLIERFGPGILCLEPVWKVHRGLPRYLFKNPPHDYHTNTLNKDRPYDSGAMSDFITAIAAVSDTVRQDAHTLNDICLSFVRLSQTYNSQMSEQLSHVPGGTVDPTLPCGIYDRRRNIVQLVKDTRVVLDHLQSATLPEVLPRNQDTIARYPDARICIREEAPSRKKWMENINKDIMRTRAGFFSALVFRNILFNSEALVQRPDTFDQSHFANLAEWDVYVASLYDTFPNRSPDFFCNKFALGHYIEHRTIEQAQHFWSVSVSCEWPEPEEWPLSFSDMHSLLRRIKCKKGLPGCGALSLYLLCTDMVYYGMVDRPLLSDMAGIVRSLDMGALSGLAILGYLKKDKGRKPSLDVVGNAIEAFRQDIFLLLTAHDVHMDTSYIDVEHILCKFSRLWNLRSYRDALPL